jgi:hypothetical protein
MLTYSANTFTINRLFELIREAVLYFNDDGFIKTSTYAYINGLDDLNKPNLGYDFESAKSRYFLSKDYEKKKTSSLIIGYPLVAVAEFRHILSGAVSGSTYIDYVIKMWVLDLVNDEKDNIPINQARTSGQINRDCETILLNILSYFNNVKFCKIVNLDASITYGYYNTTLLDYQVDEELITSYTHSKGDMSNVSSLFYQYFIAPNEDSELNLEAFVSEQNLSGVGIELRLTQPFCIEHEFDFSFTSNNLVNG